MKQKAEKLGKHIYRHNCDETTAGELILAFVKKETENFAEHLDNMTWIDKHSGKSYSEKCEDWWKWK